jgi:mono/diheme cytochrome c family protein
MPFQEKKEEEKSFALHFLILSLLLIVFSVWGLWEETTILRPWKAYQKEYYTHRYRITEQELQRAKEELKKPRVQEEYQRLKSLLEEEKNKFNKSDVQKEYNKLKDRIKQVDREISNIQNDLLINRNIILEQEYQYTKFKKEKNKKKIEELEEEVRLLEDKKKEMVQKRDDLKKKLESFTLYLEKYAEELKLFPFSSRVKELEKLLISFKNPKIEIKQYYIEDLKKVDRCISCHQRIDNPLQNNYPPPFTTHPAYSIYLKNHPPQQFGCTICHQGQGRATSSIEKAHGRVEFWNEPMFEGEDAQANCQHCHQDIDHLRGAEILKEGDKILKKSVCFGCHRIDGYESIDKISPPLSHIGEKVSYTWLVKWLMDPSRIVEGATMPNYNFSKEDAQAIADYLYGLTQTERKDEPAEEEMNWNLYDKGKVIYSQSICSICHSANGRGGAYKDMFAPDLSRVGSKIKSEWLKQWLRNPKGYFRKARMSHYKFTEEETESLTEYLSGEYIDWDLEDEKMSQSLPIEETSIQKGAILIKEYGCFGCHDIEGLRDIQEIGPYLKIDELEELVADELTSFGDKPMQEFDFGKLTKIPKIRADYLRIKLDTPRAFRDDAKMPQYNLSEEEINALVTLVLGFSKEEPLVKYRVEKKESDYQPAGEFAEVLEDVKCLSCHKIYGKGSDYAPDLTIEGSRVKKEWLKNYLKSPDIIRPMSEQMPKFNLGRTLQMSELKLSKNEIDTIADYIMTVLVNDEVPKDFLKEETMSQADIDKGREIYLEKGCQACHQIGERGGAVGPPLSAVGLRLAPGYIYKHLLNPKISNTNTVEPILNLSKKESLTLTKFLMSLKGEK